MNETINGAKKKREKEMDGSKNDEEKNKIKDAFVGRR